MESTVKGLLLIETSLGRLLASPDLSAHVAFRLAPMAKVVLESLKTYQEQRTMLVKKHGTFNAEKEKYFVPEGSLVEFEEKLALLASEKVILPDVAVFHREVENAKLSPIDLANLDFMIHESKQ